MHSPSPDFRNLRVAAFESRRSAEIESLIARWGGRPSVSPALQEIPLSHNPAAVDFASRLITGQIDLVILQTGAAVRAWISQIERSLDRGRVLATLSDIPTVARGPKPAQALRELGLKPTHRTEPPHTWREILGLIDRALPVANQVVGLLEYGETNTSLLAGLEARGAQVANVRVYSWALPADLGPLTANIKALASGEIGAALFTSSQQVVHLLQTAEQIHESAPLRAGLKRTVIGSIGPATSETLRQHGIAVDVESARPNMGALVAETAAQASHLLAHKRRIGDILAAVPPAPQLPPPFPKPTSLFLRAARCEPTERTPIWLMRQAGRYLPEYRAIREKTTFLELCKNPRLCAEVMISTVNRLQVDAAIIFADLLPILEPMGLDLEFASGEGPIIHNPVRSASDVDRVLELDDVHRLDFVFETVRLTRAGLPDSIPVLGFAGAPFTLASYVIEGGASRNYLHTKSLMYRDPPAWDALLGKLSRAVARYLNAQIAAGAECVQLFDSWVGCLSPHDYQRFVLPHMHALIAGISPQVPLIHFGAGNPALLPLLAQAGGSVLGLDWRVDLADGWRAVGHDRAVQGNLDPLVLLAEPAEIRRQAREILRQAHGRPGHIFNLGHGVLPQTPVENVLALIDEVKNAPPYSPA